MVQVNGTNNNNNNNCIKKYIIQWQKYPPSITLTNEKRAKFDFALQNNSVIQILVTHWRAFALGETWCLGDSIADTLRHQVSFFSFCKKWIKL